MKWYIDCANALAIGPAAAGQIIAELGLTALTIHQNARKQL